MEIPLPAIIEQQLDMLAVIDKDNLLIQQTNSWRSAYLKWQQLFQRIDWVPIFTVNSIGLGFYELSRAKSGEVILSTNNQEEVYKKAYKLNYESYSAFRQKEKTGCRSNSSIHSEINFNASTLNNISEATLELSFLETLRNKLIKRAEPDKILTSRMILDLPEVIDLPINEYEQLCQMLVLSGILIFDSDEQLKNWQETNGKKKILPSVKVGKCFKRFFKKAIKIDDSQKVLIDELMKQPRLPHGGVSYYQVKAEQEDPDAVLRLFFHYAGPVIRYAMGFYENNHFSSLQLGDLIQESLIILYSELWQLWQIGRARFHSNLMFRLRNALRRTLLNDFNCRIPVHVWDKCNNLIVRENRFNRTFLSINLIDSAAKELKLSQEAVHRVVQACCFPQSLELIFEEYEPESVTPEIMPTMYFDFDDREKKHAVDEVLRSLTDRERDVIRERFGINKTGGSKTLEEVGVKFKVTRERIRQIEKKALRKLRHPSRSKKLKDFYLCC